MSDHRRGDIIKCRPFQPEIRNHDNYASYLWVQTYQGYFVMRQRFVEQHACEWRVVREVEVDDAEPAFFDDAEARFLEEFQAFDDEFLNASSASPSGPESSDS